MTPLSEPVPPKVSNRILNFLEKDPCEIYAAPFDVLLTDYVDQKEDDIATVVQPRHIGNLRSE